MASSFVKTQLFFKRLLLERVSNPDIYKDFNINLNYDLTDGDLDYLLQIIIHNEYLYNINIRLSDTLKDSHILNKLLSKINTKKQFTYLNFYIKYLNDNLFFEFTNFILNINSSVTSFKLQMKYKNKDTEEKYTKIILKNLIKNENLNIYNLYFVDCSFSSYENMTLLNELLIKNKNKIKNIYLYNSIIYNNNFIADVSSLKTFEISYFNLSQIKFFPKEKLNLSNNNISLDGIQIISEYIKNQNCTLQKLNLNNNYIGDEGCTF